MGANALRMSAPAARVLPATANLLTFGTVVAQACFLFLLASRYRRWQTASLPAFGQTRLAPLSNNDQNIIFAIYTTLILTVSMEGRAALSCFARTAPGAAAPTHALAPRTATRAYLPVAKIPPLYLPVTTGGICGG